MPQSDVQTAGMVGYWIGLISSTTSSILTIGGHGIAGLAVLIFGFVVYNGIVLVIEVTGEKARG